LRRREGKRAFELDRRTIVQSRVESLFIVDLLEKLDRTLRLQQIPVFLPVHLLVLQRLHERFASRMLICASSLVVKGLAGKLSKCGFSSWNRSMGRALIS
jgi:hypothetical protein